MMLTLWQDLRYAARVLRKNLGFTTVAVLAVALGVGANTAIFSLVNAALLRPLPVAAPERLYALSVSGAGGSMLAFSYPTYRDFSERSGAVLDGLFAIRPAPVSLSRGGDNQRLWGYIVSGNYFDVLGVRAARGRTFTTEEDAAPLTHPVVVISHACWQSRFGGDPSVVGRDITLNGRPFRVVGVAPEGFKGTELIYTPEVWVPTMMQEWIEPGNVWLDRRSTQNIFATGRLKDGVTPEQAESALNLLAEQLGREYPETNEGQRITLMSPGYIIPQFRNAVLSFAAVLMGLVVLVLLIACVNVAGLLLARASSRRREIAIRLALGAGRWRLIRQLLTESLLLALVGGAAGLLLALWITELAAAYRPPVEIPVWIDLAIDWRVALFALAASLATSLLFGLVPALQATRPELVPALKDSSARAGRGHVRLRGALVVAQVAFSLLLLVAAGLVVRALSHLQTTNPGFEVENGLILSYDLGQQGYDADRGAQFHRQLLERVGALPGVRAATVTDLFPLSLNYSSNNVYVEGQPAPRGANVPQTMVASVGPDFFPTMGTPVVAGREFAPADDGQAAPVIIINETLARRFFPGEDPVRAAVGRRLSFGSAEGPFRQIVGVARDGKYWTIGEAPQLMVYFPLAQSYSSTVTMLVRSEGDPRALVGSIRGAARTLDEGLPLYDVKTVEDHLGVSLFPARVAATLLGGFAFLALALSALGVYGVVSFAASQRTREIGIRVALGAQKRDVFRLVGGRGLLLVSVGVGLGLAAAFALTRFMSSLLYGVSATDPATFAFVVALLGAVALLACYVPARRAARVDPVVALRHE